MPGPISTMGVAAALIWRKFQFFLKSCPGIHYRTPLLGMTQRHSNLEQLAAQFKQLGLVREPPSRVPVAAAATPTPAGWPASATVSSESLTNMLLQIAKRAPTPGGASATSGPRASSLVPHHVSAGRGSVARAGTPPTAAALTGTLPGPLTGSAGPGLRRPAPVAVLAALPPAIATLERAGSARGGGSHTRLGAAAAGAGFGDPRTSSPAPALFLGAAPGLRPGRRAAAGVHAGSAGLDFAATAPLPSTAPLAASAAQSSEADRARALQRLRDQKRKKEQAEEALQRQIKAADLGNDSRRALRQQAIEDKELRRAEIYAINAVMRAYNEVQFETFMRQRATSGGRRPSVADSSTGDESEEPSSSESDG